jgi:ketosteroid isomerase-like protein
MSDLKELLDRRAIEDVYYRYAHLLDTQQAHRVAVECFTEDAILTYHEADIDQGRAAIEKRFETYPNMIEATSHNITNISVQIRGDEADAIARAMGYHWLLQHKHLGPERPVDFLMVAAMDDKFRRCEDGWRIARRTVRSIGPGKLSIAYGATWGPMDFPHLRDAPWPHPVR